MFHMLKPSLLHRKLSAVRFLTFWIVLPKMNSFLRHCLQAFKLHLVGQQIQSHIMTLKRKFGRHTGKCTSYAERILIQECARPDLLPGSSSGSKSAEDYRFRLLDCEIEEYTRLADLRHGLMLLRYGSSRLYPYLMTRVDIVPLLLKELPFHSLFRGSTEGGEHCHYLHQCIYYAHSSRGGGWRKEEPMLALFKWTFRRLREKIEQAGQTGEFLKFVRQRI